MIPTRQELRAEETKAAILKAAGELFSNRGFEAVTMREIAKQAGCSHTTIYIYFKDKDALLHALSMGPLESLHQDMTHILTVDGMDSLLKLRSLSKHFIYFCLMNRNMYTILFMTRASRVDETEPELVIQKKRNDIFALLQQAIKGCMPVPQPDETILAFARAYFFTLHGILITYIGSEEPLDLLLERLNQTFDLSFEMMALGMIALVERGDTRS